MPYAISLLLLFAACSTSTGPDDNQSLCSNIPNTICTYAGTGDAGFNGDGRPLLASTLYWPIDLTITPTGTTYILDWNNHRVRRVDPDSTLTTVIGTDFVGDGPYDQSDLTAPGAAGTTVHLNHPTHLLPLADGALLLTAWHNHKLRLYDPTTGLVQVICGSDPGFAGDGGPARDALLSQPPQTVQSPDGSLYILDQRNQRVRKIDPQGIITTVVGDGTAGFAGDGGDPLNAQLQLPAGSNPPPAGGLAFGPDGQLYIADALNHRIRRVDFAAAVIETVAGNGTADFADGPALAAAFNNPRDLAFGPDGRLYIADEFNHRIRVLDLGAGTLTTIAGNGEESFSGDGGTPADAGLNRPAGLAFDADGRLYIADTYNHRIRRASLP